MMPGPCKELQQGLVAEYIVAVDVTGFGSRLMQMHFVMHMCLLAAHDSNRMSIEGFMFQDLRF